MMKNCTFHQMLTSDDLSHKQDIGKSYQVMWMPYKRNSLMPFFQVFIWTHSCHYSRFIIRNTLTHKLINPLSDIKILFVAIKGTPEPEMSSSLFNQHLYYNPGTYNIYNMTLLCYLQLDSCKHCRTGNWL